MLYTTQYRYFLLVNSTHVDQISFRLAWLLVYQERSFPFKSVQRSELVENQPRIFFKILDQCWLKVCLEDYIVHVPVINVKIETIDSQHSCWKHYNMLNTQFCVFIYHMHPVWNYPMAMLHRIWFNETRFSAVYTVFLSVVRVTRKILHIAPAEIQK